MHPASSQHCCFAVPANRGQLLPEDGYSWAASLLLSSEPAMNQERQSNKINWDGLEQRVSNGIILQNCLFLQAAPLGVSKRILLPSRIFCLSQKPFIWNTNMPAAACDGACRWAHTPSKDSSWECSGRLREADGPPVAHSSYLLFGFPRASDGTSG